MSRFVTPGIRVLTLADGSTLTVRRRLNREEHARMLMRMRPPGEVGRRTDALKVGPAMVIAYLLDWNLVGDAMPIRQLIEQQQLDELERVLSNLDPDAFQELFTAIGDHDSEIQAERDALKKAQAGVTGSPATSTSPSDAAGPTTT